VNVLSLCVLAINHDAGHAIPPDVAAALLAVLNVALRFATSQGVSLAK
jgi:hypothetical protein